MAGAAQEAFCKLRILRLALILVTTVVMSSRESFVSSPMWCAQPVGALATDAECKMLQCEPLLPTIGPTFTYPCITRPMA